MMAEESDLLNDFETFKENFSQAIREENFEVQIDMTRKLGILAKHLGEDITRTKLLPFIKENIDFHDEILLNLSDQLKYFVPLVGGYENSQPVLELLKKLCNIDETVVREKTIEAIKIIAENLNSELTEQLLVPVLGALATEDWFTSKCSAVTLFPIIYPKVQEERKDELRHSFRLLAQDDSPIVRKSAAICLVDLIPMIDKEHLKNEFISVFDNISQDNMDSVKVHAFKIAICLCKKFAEIEIEQFIFPTLENFADNESWKIRQVLALNIAEIQEVIPFPKLRGRILAMFQKLIKDDEEEVRILAVKHLVRYCQNLKCSYEKSATENNFEAVFLQSIVPQIALLVVDSSIEVKLELANNILSMSKVISKESFMEHIMPMAVGILEEDNSISVKAAILENLNDLPEDVDLAETLPSIKNVLRTVIVYSQSHWRTRKGLLLTFVKIAKLSTEKYFLDNLKIFYASLLGDPVFGVRRTAPIILPVLAKRYGINWTATQIIPYFKMFLRDSRYLYRYVLLFGINELIEPSVIAETHIKYLNSLRYSEDTNTTKSLFELRCMLTKLTNKLNENPFKDVLSLNKSIDDFKTDNIVLYAEDTVHFLRKLCNADIFAYDTEKPNEWYLTGLISLIYRDFLDLILQLFDDKIVNVQIRSIFTLNKIKVFSENISKELEEDWVEKRLKLLTEEECNFIKNKVDTELNEKIEEKGVDTKPIEDIFTEENSLHMRKSNSSEIPEINIEFADSSMEFTEVYPSESNVDVAQKDTKFTNLEDNKSISENSETSLLNVENTETDNDQSTLNLEKPQDTSNREELNKNEAINTTSEETND